ncbi:MAG: C1 family peptidase [Candidatus Eisenbacteria bacterium]|nr:C1 family peptidase [Candidatus Eisenbacteria bacterium]
MSPTRRSARTRARTLSVSVPDDFARWQRPSAPALRVAKSVKRARGRYLLAARPDTVDFRDRMYQASLVEVPRERPLEDFLRLGLPVLDQGREGACTGFALATVVHYLLRTRAPSGDAAGRRRERDFDRIEVSPHMLYRMARRYDEWAGEDDDGSSARGAMKGWFKHGVCSLSAWPAADPGVADTLLTDARARDALARPLGGYTRVNHRDLVALHAALAEVGILYATAWVHAGWEAVKSDGRVDPRRDRGNQGGHAFAIVGYDRDGFWLQNSWGGRWGRRGFGHVTYGDWLKNGTDVWVGRLGAPVGLAARTPAALETAASLAGGGVKTPLAIADLRPHVVSIGNDGRLRNSGIMASDAQAVHQLFSDDFVRITKGWKKRRLLLYAHGGLCDEDGALHRIQDYRRALLEAEVYPLAFVWKTDYWTTIRNVLEDAQRRRKPEGILDATRDFLLNRLDDALEPVARAATGKLEWDQMKQNGLAATLQANGGARLVAEYVRQLAAQGVEVHVAGHSAGSIFMAPLVRLLATRGAVDWTGMPDASGLAHADSEPGLGVPIESVTMWAPACTIDLFARCYKPVVDARGVGRFALFTLTDKAEQDDHCAHVYNKSLLYLVSHAFEATARNPLIPVGAKGRNLFAAGVGILGMEWWLTRHPETRNWFQRLDGASSMADEGAAVWVLSPNAVGEGSRNGAGAKHHGDFDDDGATVQATLARILGRPSLAAGALRPTFERTAASRRDRREAYNRK